MRSLSGGTPNRTAGWPSPLLRILCSLIVCGCSAAGQALQALVIGNGAYRGQCRVESPKRNAEAIAAALKKIGFNAAPALDLDETALRNQINEFATGLHAGDTVFFYYSGLAIQTLDRNWLLPVTYQDGPLQDIGTHAFALNRVLELLDEKKLKTAIVVLDASRFCPDWGPTRAGLTSADPKPSSLLSFSAPAGTTVPDPAGGGVNLFTSTLIKTLMTHGLKPGDVFDHTQTAMSQASNGRNIPWVQSLAVGDFYLTGPPDPVLTPKVERKAGELRPNPRGHIDDAWIPPGSFQMGCVGQKDKQCEKDENPAHLVEITQGFWMTTTEITIEAYKQFIDATNHKPPPPTKTNGKGDFTNLPQTKVTWQDAEDYCKWAGGEGGRLPTEAEWEYAARGGKEGTIYPWGDAFDPAKLNSFKGSKKKAKIYTDTTPARNYDPNGFQLFDMAGNAREWTLDAYNAQSYDGPGPFVDPEVKQGLKTERVVRGGDFSETQQVRISARDHIPGESADNRTGFRCVTPEAP
jgi:formylglycine-generating enzyme required for sulfatase activity